MVIDLGTGDGAAVLRQARRAPRDLVVGIDTDAAALREASHRAARPAAKGGIPNALFLAGDARDLPLPLHGQADEIRVTLPWGSLLRAALCPRDGFATVIRGALKRGGACRLLLSVTERDAAVVGAATFTQEDVRRLAARYADCGLPSSRDARPATADDVVSLGSSWAKRLGIPTRREAWVFELLRGDEETARYSGRRQPR